jgi:hypothetical protein
MAMIRPRVSGAFFLSIHCSESEMRLVVVVAERHHHGGDVEAEHAGEIAGHCGAQAEQQQGKVGEPLFAHEEQQEDHGEGEEARHLAQAFSSACQAAKLSGTAPAISSSRSSGRRQPPETRDRQLLMTLI